MIIAVNGLVTGPFDQRGVAGAGKDEVARRLVEKHGFVVISLADPLKRFCQDVYEFSEEQLWGPSEKRNEQDGRYLRGCRLHCGCLADKYEWAVDGESWFIRELLDTCEAHSSMPGWYRGRIFSGNPPPLEYLTPRHALQQLGTEWGRRCYDTTWVEYTLRIYKRLQAGDCYYDRVSGLRTFASCELAKGKTNIVIPDVRFINEMSYINAAGGHIWRIKRNYDILPGYFAGHLSETELLNLPDEEFNSVLDNSGTLEELYAKVDKIMERPHV